MAVLAPRPAEPPSDPTTHYLVHACKDRRVLRFTSSDRHFAYRMRATLFARGWAVLLLKSLPGAPPLDGDA